MRCQRYILKLDNLSTTKMENPYPQNPSFPKQSTLTWFLLKLLEEAYRQSNTSFGQGFTHRRLRKVLLTYPSGWSNAEVEMYFSRCQEALDIFSHTNILGGVNGELKLEMIPRKQTPDEAVASQLPFVFNEVIKTGSTTASWISLIGKERRGRNSVRIMNFDIGGGTTDISVVEYTDSSVSNNSVVFNDLKATLLFKDGKALAGDDLLKRIIECLIFPSLADGVDNKDEMLNWLDKKFGINARPGNRTMRSRIVQSCLVPLAVYCLKNMDKGSELLFSPQKANILPNYWKEFVSFLTEQEPDCETNKQLQAAIGKWSNENWSKDFVKINIQSINNLIEELFVALFKSNAKYAAAYDIDLLIFSGKTSELPYMQEMARKYIPINSSRVIFARKYRIGTTWYPFTTNNGFIKDAKTVTVVGAALYYALSNGYISNWHIESEDKAMSDKYEWGQLDAMIQSNNIFMEKTDKTITVKLPLWTIIARRRNAACTPEPVYRFLKKENGNKTSGLIKVQLARTADDALCIKAIDGQPVQNNDYYLKLWPCKGNSGMAFWQEEGVFSILKG